MKSLFVSVGICISLAWVQLAAAETRSEIHACFVEASGRVRIVSAPGQCRRRELPLTWNTTGPQGPAGPAGPPGETGFGELRSLRSTDSIVAVRDQAPVVIPGLTTSLDVLSGSHLLLALDAREWTGCPGFVQEFSTGTQIGRLSISVNGEVVASRSYFGEVGNISDVQSHTLATLEGPFDAGIVDVMATLEAEAGARPDANPTTTCIGDSGDSGNIARLSVVEVRATSGF